MVDWQDPSLLIQDYLAITKLIHAMAGVYIWEIVSTFDFEWNVLRGKQPYRWTIWIYLATRYCGLITFIIIFIHNDGGLDGGRVSCQAIVVANFAFAYLSWALSSSLIILRVLAIWDRNIIVSSIAVGSWLAAFAINIRTLTKVEAKFNSFLIEACVVLKTHTGLWSSASILAVDAVLLVIMLIGLLRQAHLSFSGIWHLLYRQCIIWMVLAAIAEVPPVVFLILNLNDAWNEMFPGVGITILCICATRMYRSLSMQGSFTEYSSVPHQFSEGKPVPNYQRGEARGINSTIVFTTTGTVTQSDRTMADAPVFVPADEVSREFNPGASTAILTVPEQSKSKDMPGYRLSPRSTRVDVSRRVPE